MTDLAHGIWAAATASVAFAGHRVAITWLNHRAQSNQREEFRDERDNAALKAVEGMTKRVNDLEAQWKTFRAAQR